MKAYRLAVAAAAMALAPLAASAQSRDAGWLHNGGLNSDHYSPLTQITAANVGQLKEAWRFAFEAGGLESQPIMIGKTLYAITPGRRVVALDAATGKQTWAFEPKVAATQPIRGLASWSDGGKLRILFGRDNLLYMLDAETGQPVPSFGADGHIDVREDLRGKAEDNAIYITSPVAVYKDLIIVNGRLAENTPASPGDVRAFSASTGKLVWTFHTIPHPGEPGADTWPKDAYLKQGGANAWSGASIDTERGIVFVNTGSPADDFYGAQRPGDNRGANSTIALDANTGKRLWDFQQVHHDLWDSDSTSAPLLTTITRDGKKHDVTVATNKQSYIYVFDRKTGKPVFPIEEKPFPASNVPGEVASKTQPIPTLPHPLSRKQFTVDDLTTVTPEANAEARELFARLYGGAGPYVPIGLNQPTLVIPGFSGGNSWGGMASDRKGDIFAVVNNGAGMTSIVDNTKARAIIGEPGAPPPAGGAQNGYARLAYAFSGYGGFILKDRTPALKGPLMVLSAVDLNTGQYKWTIPFNGGYNGGGPSVTASGLLFIGNSSKLQSYDTQTGKLLWETPLPAQTANTPAIYSVDGKEYVVLSTGGRGAPSYVAYALP